MHASEAAGGEYRDAAIDATTVLGVQIAQAIAPIENGFARQRMVELFCEHLPHAVEAARLEALSSLAGTGTRQ